MTDDSGYATRPIWRDPVALVLLVLGVAGLTTAAFAADWRLGLAVASTAIIVAGIILGTDR